MAAHVSFVNSTQRCSEDFKKAVVCPMFFFQKEHIILRSCTFCVQSFSLTTEHRIEKKCTSIFMYVFCTVSFAGTLYVKPNKNNVTVEQN